jgi:murein DD-endopeptidase MepM/ murein hydrolase activator NlpD
MLKKIGTPVVSLLSAAVLALVAAGCGQYAGVNKGSEGSRNLQLAGASTPAPVATPAPSPTQVQGDDGTAGPKSADVVGGTASTIDLHQLRRLLRSPGGVPGGRNGNVTSAPSTGSVPSVPPSPPDGSATPSPGSSRPTSLVGLADLISRATVPGFKYNSKVLPSGFPFLGCPVQGPYAYSDDYGAPRYAGGYHPHAGNDIFAAQGTPIVSPFAGYVERVPNTLGGLAVRVHGAQGYVYMAHMVAYAPGVDGVNVPAGTVVGFVGETGDARGTSPHDHFEWHPNHVAPYDRVIAGTNGAVDPFPYLQVVCPPG